MKVIKRFWGLIGYYRKFLKNYGLVAKSLTELLEITSNDLNKWNMLSKH